MQQSTKYVRTFCALTLSVFLFVCSPPPLCAQTNVGQLTGAVRDTTGAEIVGAALKVVDTEKGTSSSTVSDAAGVYRFPALPPGHYTVQCTLAGFKTFEQQGITLQLGQTLSIDVVLQPGMVTQEVIVAATTSGVETTSATVGQVVTE